MLCLQVGFNGGNGTGFVHMPYSAIGDSYKLVQYGATDVPGRWLARVDERVVYGGCKNDSTGAGLLALHACIDVISRIRGSAQANSCWTRPTFRCWARMRSTSAVPASDRAPSFSCKLKSKLCPAPG